MKPGHVSVLVSYPDYRFEIIEMKIDLDVMQKLVGGYIEKVPAPSHDSAWVAYCNEEGKFQSLSVNSASTRFTDQLWHSESDRLFSDFDLLVGPVIWMYSKPEDDEGSDEASLPVDYVQRFTLAFLGDIEVQRGMTSPVITVLRNGNDIWVFDSLRGSLIPQHVRACAEKARVSDDHGVIECYSGITPAKWTELRVEIMDDFRITLHDERADRTYG